MRISRFIFPKLLYPIMKSTPLGYTFTFLAFSVFAIQDGISKHLGVSYSPVQVAMVRYWAFVAFALFLASRAPGGLSAAVATKRPLLQVLRGLILFSQILISIVAFTKVGLAQSQAIFAAGPIFVALLSMPILGEKVGWRRWLAIVVGFGGAMIVIQPSYEIFGLTALLPVACAFLFALYMFLNRAIGDADSPMTMQTLAGIGGTLFMTAALAIGTSAGDANFTVSLPASWLGLLLLTLLGTISGFIHLLVVRAFRMAPLSVLAPFQYFEIIAAVALGYLFFDEFPSASKWLGILIIVGSGLFILWREQKRATGDRNVGASQ